MQTPRGFFREKRFRNGYAGASFSAQKQIDEWISGILECIEINDFPECRAIQTHKNNETTILKRVKQ
jgi:hypothetical protein